MRENAVKASWNGAQLEPQSTQNDKPDSFALHCEVCHSQRTPQIWIKSDRLGRVVYIGKAVKCLA